MRCLPWHIRVSLRIDSTRTFRHPVATRHFHTQPANHFLRRILSSGFFRKHFADDKPEFMPVAPATLRNRFAAVKHLEMPELSEIEILQEMLGLRGSPSPDEFRDVVFVCVDCEAYESDHSKITEIGISVLDMKAFEQRSNTKAEDLISAMQHAHYRITEYGSLVNGRFVKGWPENFTFGQSIWINRFDAQGVLGRIFRNPESLSTAHRESGETESARKVVLVGHDITNEVDFLKHLDFDLKGVGNVVRTVDTQRLAVSKKNRVGLGRLLKVLDVEAEYLHNAGNDAAYTLQALVLMAVKDFSNPGSVEEAIQAVREASHAAREAKQAAREEARRLAIENGEEPQLTRKERRRLQRQMYKAEAQRAAEGGEIGQDAMQAIASVPDLGQGQSR